MCTHLFRDSGLEPTVKTGDGLNIQHHSAGITDLIFVTISISFLTSWSGHGELGNLKAQRLVLLNYKGSSSSSTTH